MLERSYQTNRILGSVASSADGQYLAATGYKILAGPAGLYGDGAVYLFDRNGQIQWNVSSNREIFSVHINSNGSVIVANGPELLYLNNQGSILWNYSRYDAFDAAILNDGASVVAGLSNIHFPNHLNEGSEVAMFDNRGNAVWNYSVPDEVFGSTRISLYSEDTLLPVLRPRDTTVQSSTSTCRVVCSGRSMWTRRS